MENNNRKLDESNRLKWLRKLSNSLIIYTILLSLIHFLWKYSIGFYGNYNSMLPYSLPFFAIVHLILQKQHLSYMMYSSKFGAILLFLIMGVFFTFLALEPIIGHFVLR